MGFLKLSPLVILVFISWFSQAQDVGNYQSGFKREGNIFYFSNLNADVRIEFCSSRMLRIRTSWSRVFEADEPWMVVRYTWPPVAVEAIETNDSFSLVTGDISVIVKKHPFSVEVTTHDGKVLTTENVPGLSGGGARQGESVKCTKSLQSDEHFFGFGERMDFLDQRNKTVRLNVGRGQGMPHIVGAYNILDANYCPVPFFMSTRGYGIFLHNSFATEWDMGASRSDAYSFAAEGGELDYYIIYGPDFPSILDQYTTLTGKAPLMPLFALGLHVGTYSGGTWGYEHLTSAQYVITLARKFRELGIPVDILHLDSTWRIFGENGGKGATTFEWRETFQNPKGMFDSLYAMNYNLVGVHVRPRFDNGRKLRLLDKARQQGFTFPENNSPGEFVNFFDQNAVDWWWQNGVMNVASLGAKFLKTDEGSAFGHKANESDKTGPTGKEIQRLHNIFPLAYAKAPYEKFQAFNGMRGMNHTREGYAGIQRYPFIFAGDWPSEWQYFAPVIKAGLNIGLSGVGNWAHCMGGFEHPADPELYIRWCQFGLLSSVAHLFGMDHPGYKEPWNYGEQALKIFTQYDRLRYRLIPYMYSHSHRMYTTGMPLMRALVLEYQNDANVYDISDQYLLGDALMICPVTTKGAQTRTVYLPAGKWFDYWTGNVYEGKKYYNVVTPLEKLPVFVKGGAIIPMQPDVLYTDKKPWSEITLDIFPDEKSSFELYEDDGITTNYQEGLYSITKIDCEKKEEAINVMINPSAGKFNVPERSYVVKIHSDRMPESISVSVGTGKKMQSIKKVVQSSFSVNEVNSWSYDEETKTMWISVRKKPDTTLQIRVANSR